MEHNRLLHLPFARGRIENGLPPAPGKRWRPIHTRLAEAWQVLCGNAIGVRTYPDMEVPENEEPYADGEVGSHPVVLMRNKAE